MNAMLERRTCPRLSRNYRLDLVVVTGTRSGDEFDAEIFNISRSGLGMVGPDGLQKGDQLGCVVHGENYESLCVGEVVWKEPVGNRARYGVRIVRWSYLDPSLDAELGPRSNPA
jgi:hypothetical protein